MTAAGSGAWTDALRAAALFAVDPFGLGGVALRARAGPARDRWIARVRELLGPGTPIRRVPLHAGEGRLLGGLDLAATLAAGRPVAERGLFAETHGGVAVIASAERISGATAALIGAALDAGEIVMERDGFALRVPARFGAVALDEGVEDEERPPPALLDRLALHLNLEFVPAKEHGAKAPRLAPMALNVARARFPRVTASELAVEALCAAAVALGIVSLRAPIFAVRAARAAAALAGREDVAEEDAALAARLVLAPRATVVPSIEPPEEDAEPPPDGEGSNEEKSEPVDRGALEEVVLAAARAAIPPDVLARIAAGRNIRARARSSGRAGAPKAAARRGRPTGARPGDPKNGARLNVIETLRAAAPWQRLRRRNSPPPCGEGNPRRARR